MSATPALRETSSLFPIAGVGASAGGLAATTQLLRHLGPKPDIAIVIVHHLDPSHQSSLVDIFSRATSLPVEAITDGLRVERNHVYVVPPNAGLIISDGILNLTPRVETGGLHLPIDRFLESLAQDRTVNALGVVLTGTGSDGAVGIRAIKAEGGVNFAQDATAEYRSMPQSAIATGCVDFILPLDGIARELARIGERGMAASADADDIPEFWRILSTLSRTSGIDFANYKHTTLSRRVQRRVVINGLATLRDYADLLDRSADESRSLCDEVLIHVTSFFRDPDTFDALKTDVFPKLLDNRRRDAGIRVWVPGCSTGEEVYSIAIALLEFLSDANAGDIPIKLFGTDVSLGAIDKARRAQYPETIEQDVSPERLRDFFSKLEGTYRIKPHVRDLCVFAKQDATKDPPFAGMDLISCRNLMIYLGAPLQDRILPTFHYALKEPGFLVLGTSETVRSFPGFATLDAKNRIYTRTSAVPTPFFDFAYQRFPDSTTAAVATEPPTSGPLDVQRQADRLVLSEYAPPGVVITDDLAVIQFRGRTGPFLEPTPGVASLDLLRIVREDLRLPVRKTIDEARAKQAITRTTALTMAIAGAPRTVEIEVIPFRVTSTAQRFFVVLFRELTPEGPATATDGQPVADISRDAVEGQARNELASTRDYLQSVIEQAEASNEELKASNEEVVSSNEELRSTNEELQMAKEELQATNEELSTVNDELSVRNADANRLNDDLTNVLNSVEIPIVLLGRDSRVRRFTPAAANVFHLIANDVGRPISDIRPIIPASDLAAMIAEVLERLSPVTRTVQDDQGGWHELTVRPYLTLDNRIDGTVITAFDVDAVKKAAQLLGEAQRYAQSVIDTVSAGLVVLDGALRVRSANRTFHRLVGLTHEDIVGKALGDIGRGEWNLSALSKRLDGLGEHDTLEGYRVEVEFQRTGRRAFVLNARRIEKTTSILLALDDVTEKERVEQALQQTETGFRAMLTTIAEAIIMTDAAGQIVFANESSAKMFGYAMDDMMGLSIDGLVPDQARALHAQHRGQFMMAPSARRMGRDRDLLGRRKDGTEFPVEVVLGSMHQESGPLLMSFVSDITARRDSEKKIRDYQDKLQRMAFDAALAEERERRRIAADLHDRIGQSLALAQIKLTSMRETIAGSSRVAVDEAVDLLAQSINDTRTLIFELSPPVLYDLGLKAALSWLVEDVEKRHGLRVDFTDDGTENSLTDASAALVFRAVRELLMNVLKHAQVPHATMALRGVEDRLEIEVGDPGIGFDPEYIGLPSPGSGFGLFSVREQISRLGGTMDVSSAPGEGTRVKMRVPFATGEPAKLDAREERR